MNKSSHITENPEIKAEMPLFLYERIIDGFRKSQLNSASSEVRINKKIITSLEEKEIKAVKDRIKNASEYFHQGSQAQKTPQKIDMGHIVTLILCSKFLTETSLINEYDFNLNLLGLGNKDVLECGIAIIRKYDEYGNYKGPDEDTSRYYIRAENCCNLVYEYLNILELNHKYLNLNDVISITNLEDRPIMDLRSGTQKKVLQILKEIKFNVELEEGGTENIKNEIKECYEYLLRKNTKFLGKKDEHYYDEISIKYIEILKKCINLLKRSNEIFNNDPERINTYGDYLKKNISGAQELINSYNEKGEICRKIDDYETYDKKIHHCGAICCSLAYQIINSTEK